MPWRWSLGLNFVFPAYHYGRDKETEFTRPNIVLWGDKQVKNSVGVSKTLSFTVRCLVIPFFPHKSWFRMNLMICRLFLESITDGTFYLNLSFYLEWPAINFNDIYVVILALTMVYQVSCYLAPSFYLSWPILSHMIIIFNWHFGMLIFTLNI